MNVLTLSRDSWKKFKEDNNLSKSSFFKKADVGPQIDKFQKALASFKREPGRKNFNKCFSEALKLEKAFDKFAKLKEAKAELSDKAAKQLKEWGKELKEAKSSMAYIDKTKGDVLDQKDVDGMYDRFSELGL